MELNSRIEEFVRGINNLNITLNNIQEERDNLQKKLADTQHELQIKVEECINLQKISVENEDKMNALNMQLQKSKGNLIKLQQNVENKQSQIDLMQKYIEFERRYRLLAGEVEHGHGQLMKALESLNSATDQPTPCSTNILSTGKKSRDGSFSEMHEIAAPSSLFPSSHKKRKLDSVYNHLTATNPTHTNNVGIDDLDKNAEKSTDKNESSSNESVASPSLSFLPTCGTNDTLGIGMDKSMTNKGCFFLCKKEFRKNPSSLRQLFIHCYQQLRLACEICNNVYYGNNQLWKHMKERHNMSYVELECALCGDVVSNETQPRTEKNSECRGEDNKVYGENSTKPSSSSRVNITSVGSVGTETHIERRNTKIKCFTSDKILETILLCKPVKDY